jgi:hypothetical protein
MGRRLTPDGREKEEKIQMSGAFVRKHRSLSQTSNKRTWMWML